MDRKAHAQQEISEQKTSKQKEEIDKKRRKIYSKLSAQPENISGQRRIKAGLKRNPGIELVLALRQLEDERVDSRMCAVRTRVPVTLKLAGCGAVLPVFP